MTASRTIYPYVDEQGKLLFEVVRVQEADGRKKFLQQRPGPGPDDYPVYGLNGTRRVLYRLPELVKADVVYVVEGEKDADRLAANGMVATTNSGGANAKWLPEYSESLRGRAVFIFPDCDDPGRKHARDVYESLDGIASSRCIVELPGLPEKGDVSDFFDMHGDREGKAKLLALAQQALTAEKARPQRGDAWESKEQQVAAAKARANGNAPREIPILVTTFEEAIPISKLGNDDDEECEWLWHGFVAKHNVTLFSALWKAGKTTLLAHMIRALKGHGEFCGRAIRPAKVLYITEEHKSRWRRRREELDIRDHVHILARPFKLKPHHPEWQAFIGHVCKLIDKHGYDLVVFDTLSNLWPVRDENDASEISAAILPFHSITEKAALLIVHHLRKGDGQEATAARGSGALPAFVDTIVELRRFDAADRKSTKRVLAGYGRWEETPAELVIELHPQTGEFLPVGDRQEAAATDALKHLETLLPKTRPGFKFNEIKANWPAMSVPGRKTIYDALTAGMSSNRILRDGSGVSGQPYSYWWQS